MKHIELLELPDARGGQVVSYRQVIEEAMRNPLDRQTGATIDEMRKSIRVLDALDRSNGSLELEDADWEFLKQKIDKMPWALNDRRILQLYDDVMGAK